MEDPPTIYDPASPSDDETKRKWARSDRKAQALIEISLSDEYFEHVRAVGTAR